MTAKLLDLSRGSLLEVLKHCDLGVKRLYHFRVPVQLVVLFIEQPARCGHLLLELLRLLLMLLDQLLVHLDELELVVLQRLVAALHQVVALLVSLDRELN